MTTVEKNGASVVEEPKRTRGKGTTIKVTPPKITPQPEEAEVQEIEKQVIAVTLVGTSQLIVNNFDEKSVQQMENDRALTADQKRAKKREPKPPVVPFDRWQAARILNEDGEDCVPARWIKAALVTATKYPDVSIPGTQLRGAVYVLGDLIPIRFKGLKKVVDAEGKTVETDGVPCGPCGLPAMRRDIVRVGKFPNKVPDIRYRPAYNDWELDLRIEFEPKLITLQALYHLIRRAGSSVGLCEWRPEKSPAGIYGRFDIKGVRAKVVDPTEAAAQ